MIELTPKRTKSKRSRALRGWILAIRLEAEAAVEQLGYRRDLWREFLPLVYKTDETGEETLYPNAHGEQRTIDGKKVWGVDIECLMGSDADWSVKQRTLNLCVLAALAYEAEQCDDPADMFFLGRQIELYRRGNTESRYAAEKAAGGRARWADIKEVHAHQVRRVRRRAKALIKQRPNMSDRAIASLIAAELERGEEAVVLASWTGEKFKAETVRSHIKGLRAELKASAPK